MISEEKQSVFKFSVWSSVYLFVTIIIVYIGLCLLLVWLKESLLLWGIKGDFANKPKGRNFESFTIKSDQESIQVWYLPHSKKDKKAPLVIFFHGSAACLNLYVEEMERFFDWGFDVLTLDYRGCGLSTGQNTESGILKDGEAIYNHATKILGYKEDKIIVYGYSLGCVPASWIASQNKPGLCIIQNGFSHFMQEMARIPGIKVPGISSSLAPRHYVKNIKSPLVILHGKNDLICRNSEGVRLYHYANPGNRWFLDTEGGHVKIFQDEKVIKFLKLLSDHFQD